MAIARPCWVAQSRPTTKTFDIDSYADEVDRGVRPLELKDRIGLMSDALRPRLPED